METKQDMSPLRRWRRKEKLTLEEVGRRLGVGAAAVCKWELRKVPAERVAAVSAVSGLPREALRPDVFESAA